MIYELQGGGANQNILSNRRNQFFSVPGGESEGGTIRDAQVGRFSGQSEQTWFEGCCINALSRFFSTFWSAIFQLRAISDYLLQIEYLVDACIVLIVFRRVY